MTIKRYRVSWSNFSGAPGVSTLYFASTVTDFTPVKTFFGSVAAFLPNGLTLSYPTTVDVLDEVTGLIQTTTAATTLTQTVSAVASSAYSGTSGAIVRWITPDYVDGKHVVGRTYLVPLSSGSYDTNGSLSSTPISTIQTAGLTLLGATSMVVWQRPRAANALKGITARVGSSHAASNVLVPDLACVMRSRRV
jgi:hypothetical protein